MENKIFPIALTGENASGKGVVAETIISLYAGQYEVIYCNTRELILSIAKKQKINIKDRKTLSEFSDRYTETFGGDVYCYDFFNKVKLKKHTKPTILIMDSIRRVDEARFIKRNDGLIISVVAQAEIRYQRALDRGSLTDNIKTLEDFIALDYAENSPEPWKLNLKETMKHAHLCLSNNSTKDDFVKEIKDKSNYFISSHLTKFFASELSFIYFTSPGHGEC